jgi:hypothetical protein
MRMFQNIGVGRLAARALAVVGLALFVTACATGATGASSKSTGGAADDTIGAVEAVLLVEQEMALPARIDTGATTCSLDARDIKNVERDGKPWVRFVVVDRKTAREVEVTRRVVRTTTIKRHGAADSVRPVVTMEIVLSAAHTEVEFTLTDRSDFEYPILVGRNLLEGRFVVDVSLENSAPPVTPGK